MSEQNSSAPVQAALPRQETEGERMAGVLEEPVLFEYGRSDLSDGAQETLHAKVVILASHPRVRLEIAGYADARGTLRYNQALGLRRAQALCDYLIRAGLSSERFQVVSHGKERQLTSGTTEIDYALNRRGEFTVLSGLPEFEKR